MAARLPTTDRRPTEMARQDSTGLGSVLMTRTGSAELLPSLKQRSAGLGPAKALRPFRARSPAQQRRGTSLKAAQSQVLENPQISRSIQPPADYFSTPFQPSVPGVQRPVNTVRTPDEFWDQIDLHPDRLVVLMSKSYGCRPCKAFNKKYERVAAQNPDAVFLEIFGDENDDTRAKNGLQCVPDYNNACTNASDVRILSMMIDMCVKVTPSFHMFKGGRLCHMHTGISEDNLRNAVASHHPHYDPAQP